MRTTLPRGEGIRWPQGKQIAVLLTFDFDADRLQAARFAGARMEFADRSRGLYGPEEGIWRCLDMLRKQQVSATFFVPGVVCQQYPDQVRAIARAGHEIGFHGYRHESSPRREQEHQDMLRAERIIFELTGQRLAGHRGPDGSLFDYSLELLLRRRGYPVRV